MIDSHAHVDAAKFDQDRDDVIARARAAGVRAWINVGADVASSERSVALAAKLPFVWATVGIHPHHAATVDDADWERVRELLGRPRVVAVGECGLDRGPWNKAPLAAQERLLRRHVELARELDLPLVVHNRDTYPDLFRILEDESRRGPVRGVMHCFSGDETDARRSVELGFWVSFSGVLTFKNAPKTRAAARVVPLDRLMVETDCPYLTPEPRRGERNEPAYVVHTAQRLAEVLGLSFEQVEELTVRNTVSAFGLPEAVLAGGGTSHVRPPHAGVRRFTAFRRGDASGEAS